jgi:monoamine oxidase
VVAGGYSQVTDHLLADYKRLGGKVQFKTTVKTVNEDSEGWCLETKGGKDVIGKTCVLAIPSAAIQKLNKDVTRRIPALPHLAMKPLVRMYAVFKDKEWLKDLHKIVCDSKIRYVIPISAESGVIMISYTDGEDASYWIRFQQKHGDKAVQNAIMKEIRKLLPDKDIGEPTEFVIHPWSNGCTYWLPGTYDPEKILKESMNPAPGLFICGESFSMRQAWVEGALESAGDLLEVAAFKKQIKKDE